MNKKYQVFISSTYSDLISERLGVAKTVLELDCIPCGMEAFCSESNEQFQIIKKIIDLCDYYVLIIAHRYGSINEDANKSYTEMEFEYALAKGIPILAFVANNDAKYEYDEHKELLETFIKRVCKDRMVSFWSNKDELCREVAVSLSKNFKNNEAIGWVRFDETEKDIKEKNILTEENANLKNEISKLSTELKKVQNTLNDILSVDETLIYDQQTIRVPVHRYGNDVYEDITIKEIFGKVSIHFINVSKREDLVLDLIKDAIDDDRSSSIETIVLKKICNQMIALNLFETYWSSEKNGLFYSLTPKGRKERDAINLFTLSQNVKK